MAASFTMGQLYGQGGPTGTMATATAGPSVAGSSPSPTVGVTANTAPAFAWLAIVIGLIALRVLYEMGGKA